MKREGKNLETIQAMNRALVLRLLQQNQNCSRAYLAELSGLKQATITNIINDFISWGLVEETGLIEGSKGRRAIGIQLKEGSFYVIGIRLSRKYVDIGLFTLMGELVEESRRSQNTDTSPEVVLSKIRKEIDMLRKEHHGKKILAVGIAVPGPYYRDEDEMENVLEGWEKVAVRKELQKGLDIPVVIDHDANAGVLAECSFSKDWSKYETVLYLAVGQGIGAGLYHDGSIFRGATGIAGEIGHMSVQVDGIACECGGRGCLLHYASTMALMKCINEELKKLGKEPVKYFREIVAPIRMGEEPYIQCFRTCMRYLSVGIINALYNYNPELVIIGDEMGLIGEPVIREIKENLSRQSKIRVVRQTEVQLTAFDRDAAFIGAAELAVDYAFRHTEMFR